MRQSTHQERISASSQMSPRGLKAAITFSTVSFGLHNVNETYHPIQFTIEGDNDKILFIISHGVFEVEALGSANRSKLIATVFIVGFAEGIVFNVEE